MAEVAVKICGLSRIEHIHAATKAGARYIGFVFYEKSPRYVDVKTAHALAMEVPAGVIKVGLVVDAHNDFLDLLTDQVPLDMLQLHGSESPARVGEIKARYGLPVMKAVGLAGPEDLELLDTYGRVSDQLLIDTKPPKGANRPGGNGVSFDWSLIAGRRWTVPWMLAGGLTQDNVTDAIAQTGARQIDLSSAVERAPGQKDAALIRSFMAAVP